MGRDFTIFARALGRVKFQPHRKGGQKKVSVLEISE
jgi:ribosomal protein L27